jgi:hypothetical protein
LLIVHVALKYNNIEIDTANSPNFGYHELYRLQNQFYERFKFPNNIIEAQSINSTIFAENVGITSIHVMVYYEPLLFGSCRLRFLFGWPLSQSYHYTILNAHILHIPNPKQPTNTLQVQGRVSDTRNFIGRELNTEYIFGLFAPSDSVSIIGRPGNFEILQFAANQNVAAASTRVNFTFPSFSGIHFPIVIDTWFTYNEKREISQYDVVFRWFGYLLQTLLNSLDPNPMIAVQKVTHALAGSICNSEQTYCNGTNTQFESWDNCVDFLTKDVRMGQSFELGMNTLLCRSVHEVMIKYRPDVHCSHVGRDGGGMCDDSISYLEKSNEVYFENSAWIPKVA